MNKYSVAGHFVEKNVTNGPYNKRAFEVSIACEVSISLNVNILYTKDWC